MSSKKVVIISLGGSLIVQDKINIKVLQEFKKVLLKNSKKHKFVIVCGGGKTARTYINGLEKEKSNKKQYLQSLIGIATTRLNARFMTYFFDKEAYWGVPNDMKTIKNLLKLNDIVFCGALRYAEHETSDGNAAKLARFFNSDFINLTNVGGLYDKDPKKFKNAKFIPEITYKEFFEIAKKIKYTPGQHFVLDQSAAYTINKYKITTFLLGPNMENLDNLLNNKYFVGTMIF